MANAIKLIGNADIKTLLSHLLRSRCIPHAMLFSGIEGIGKQQFARAFAAALIHQVPPDFSVTTEQIVDLYIYCPEGGMGYYTVEQCQDLCAKAQSPPFKSDHKVFIVNQAEQLSVECGNLLLKTLEEPIASTALILITSHKSKVLSTIRSRCVDVPFRPISHEEMMAFCMENWKLSALCARRAIELSCGSLSKIKEHINSQSIIDTERLVQMLCHAVDKTKQSALVEDLKLMDKAFASLKAEEESSWYRSVEDLVYRIFCWYRDLKLLQLDGDRERLFFIEQQEELDILSKGAVPSMDAVHAKLLKLKKHLLCRLRPSVALEYFFYSKEDH